MQEASIWTVVPSSRRLEPVPGRLHAEAELHAGRHDGAGIGRGRADAPQVLVQQVLELRPVTLEAGGVHVGDVVRDDFDIELLSQHARCADVQGSHLFSPR
jgi:hypothetical protein